MAAVCDSSLITDVQSLSSTAEQPIKGFDYRDELSTRIYDIRCRIVHAKERVGTQASAPAILPFSGEARDLAADIHVVRFIAERVMNHWSTPLP